ncbi:MAG TPA: heme-binding domain-containing protein, partial [Chloroflexota bacterium]|nr:heme-binding domain-containing protein [Chloroflexota bacterium]
NYSEWDRRQEEASESAEAVQKGSMPPAYYVWLHPEARLTAAERAELIAGLQATFGTERRRGR